MKLKKSIAVITINKDCSKGLIKTIRSVDSQDLQPSIHLIVAKKLEGALINKFKKKYRKFIIGKDNSLYNAMNIGLKNTWSYNIIFLNSGDIFFNNKSILNIKKNIKVKQNCLIFKKILQFKNIFYYPKKAFFSRDDYLPHPSFVRPPVSLKSNKVYFNENKKISADSEWIKKNIEKFNFKKINIPITKHFLGGVSSDPTLYTLIIRLEESFISFIKELIKFFLKIFFGKKNFYNIIFFFKFIKK
jgi:hypothetical protein